MKNPFIFLIILLLFCTAIIGCGLLTDEERQKTNPDYSIEVVAGNFPHISPDGTKLIFSRSGNIFICDTNGNNAIQLTNSADDIMPRWSPDGQRIGFIRKDASRFGYGFLMEVDSVNKTTRALSLTDTVFYGSVNYHDSYISAMVWDWAPTNDKIAFFHGSLYSTSLMIIKSDGSGGVLNKYFLKHSNSSG